MDLSKSTFSATSATRFVMHSAAIFYGVTFDIGQNKFVAVGSLGATTSGVKVSINQPLRQAEIDGILVKVMGNDYLEGSEMIVETTMKEWSVDNIAKTLVASSRAATASEAPTGYTVIEPAHVVETANYLENVAVVGYKQGDAQPILILMPYCINSAGMTPETANHTEAGIPIKLESRSSIDGAVNVGGEFKIFFPPNPVPLTGFVIDATLAIAVGAYDSVNPVFTPSNATNKNVSYVSSDTSKASVTDEGIVLGIAAGTSTITAIAEDGGYSDTCAVTVT